MISGRGSIELEGRQTRSVGNHRTQIEIENKMHLRKAHSHKHTLRITCHERRGQEARGNSFLRNTLKLKKINKKKMMKIMKVDGKTTKYARRADLRRSTSFPISLPGCRLTIKVNWLHLHLEISELSHLPKL